ncbi:hypothetical protein AVEN_17887-1 [Araneus ventricosus]|uniref:Uncharacterized protein n=1 Tax=Araneus ventricosus TaxID=182803 RepID=A0A4Y2I597_ARAVE|nr:hypothetical protein AVEN_17887-1 [Araneus ventricosus]
MITIKIEIFVIPLGEFSDTLFIKRCLQRVEIGLHRVLKLFVGADVLSSKTCLQLSKKVKVTRCQVSAAPCDRKLPVEIMQESLRLP